jgi:hypothetical protein
MEVKFAQVAQALACNAKQSVTLIRIDLPKVYQNLRIAALIRLRGQTTSRANLPYMSSTYESTIGLSREGMGIA